MSLNSQESVPTNPSYSVLRAGLVGGATLGLAIAGQRMATSPEMAILGWFIVVFGFFCVGYFAVREIVTSKSRKDLIRLGLVSGLIAGVVAGLAFVVMNLALSLDVAQIQLIRESAMQNMNQLSPEQAQVLKNNPLEMDQLVRLSYGIATGCCGLLVPILGTVLGAFGALSAANANNKPATP